jgi:tetratricopeptide (TPR) repeat protein
MGDAGRFTDHVLGFVVGQFITSTLSRRRAMATLPEDNITSRDRVQHSNMSAAGHSPRHHRSRQQAHMVHRLTKILRTLIAGSSGRTSGKGHRHRQGTFTSHAHSRERRGATARRAWLIKQEVSAWRIAIFGCVLLLLIWVGWRITTQTAAGSLARSDPDAALDWVADESIALDQLAQKELVGQNGNLDFARGWAQRALRSKPLDSRALTLLGLIAGRKGDEKRADALMQIAGARTWRDHEAQAWLFNRDVRRGDYAQAIAHADAIVRMDNEWLEELFPVLAALTVDARAFEALTDFLATSPPWRTWFLSQLSTRLANRARLIELYAALNETENPPTKQELRPYLDRLISDGNFEEAYQAWHRTLPPEQQARDTYLFNPDFKIPIDGLPFNWSLETVSGAEIQIVSSPDGGREPALLVEFLGARVSFENVKQLMLLSAGDYTFRGRVKTEDLVTARGLWWNIFCADSVAKTLAHTELVSGTIPWTDFAVNFQVPAADCRAQWLQLELPARIAPETKIAGQVWYRQLRIAPNLAPAIH